MNELVLRNSESAQYLYAAKKNFIMKDGFTSESHSKTVIGHFSDIHGDIKRFGSCLYLFEYFGAAFAVHTGDTAVWDMRDDCSFFAEAAKTSKVPLYNCLGNHDTFAGLTPIKNSELHRELLSPLAGISQIEGQGYYYADFPEHKIRLVVLNNYDLDTTPDWRKRGVYEIHKEQCLWLIDTLKDAATNELSVIIASHESDREIKAGANDYGFCQRYSPRPWGQPKPHEHSIITDIIDAFKHGKEININVKWSESGQTVIISDRFDECGDFLFYINGHTHGDHVGYLDTYPDQLSLGMPCSGCFPEGYHNIGEELSDLPRIPDTISEDCVNFYVLDREKRTVSIVRFGACITDELKVRRALTLKY